MVTKTTKTKKMVAKPSKQTGEVNPALEKRGRLSGTEEKSPFFRGGVRVAEKKEKKKKVVAEEKLEGQQRVEIKTEVKPSRFFQNQNDLVKNRGSSISQAESREVKPKIQLEGETKTDREAGTPKTEKSATKPRPGVEPVVEIGTPHAKSVGKAGGSSNFHYGVERYYEAIGRRKEATARVRLYTKKSTDEMPAEDKAIMIVNGKTYFEYFRAPELYTTADAPLRKLKSINRFKATAKVQGGGVRGQADAVRHGLARALVMFDQNFSKKLRKAGYLTRDARVKERRKYGLKKARKSPQWAKR